MQHHMHCETDSSEIVLCIQGVTLLECCAHAWLIHECCWCRLPPGVRQLHPVYTDMSVAFLLIVISTGQC